MPRLTKPKPGEPIKILTTSRGEPRYQVTLDVGGSDGGKRHQVRRNFRDLKAARAFVDETRVEVRRGTFTGRSDVTLGEMCDRWLKAREADVISGDLRRVTLDGYRTWLGPVRRYMGERKVTTLRHSDVEAFKAWALREGNARIKGAPLTPSAVGGTLGLLTRVLKLAVQDKIIPANPAAEVDRPSGKGRPPAAHWNLAQIVAFREAADADDLAVALRLVLCGLRRSEVLGLDWSAVDLDAGTIEVRQGRVALPNGDASKITAPKSKASRRVVPVEAFHGGTTKMLRELWLAQGRPESGLVVRDPLGRPLRPELLSDGFQRVARQAGLPKIKMHAIRHSLATALANDAAVPDMAAAALLGHDVATFHKVYAQRDDEPVQHAAEAVGAQLRLVAASE